MLKVLLSYVILSALTLIVRNIDSVEQNLLSILIVILVNTLYFMPVLLAYFVSVKYLFKNIRLTSSQYYLIGAIAVLIELLIGIIWAEPNQLVISSAIFSLMLSMTVLLSQRNRAKT